MRFSFQTALPLFSVAALSCTFALVACSGSDGGSETPDSGASSPDAGSSTPDASPDAPVAIDCPVPTAGPTMHHGDLADDETWTAAGSPHIVTNDVTIRGGRTLTIEPCAEVQLAKGAHIEVAFPSTPNTGTLIAEGTASKPITFKGQAGATWASIRANKGGTVSLAYTTLENGGGGDFERGATIMMTGDSVMPADGMLFVDHVTVKGSLGAGVWLSRGAKFVSGSAALTITGSGSDTDPFPLALEEHAIDSLPTGAFTGNKVDEILLERLGNGVAGSGLVVDATLHDRGVPYRVGTSKGSTFVVGGGEAGTLATLTIEAGVVMKFQEGGAFEVQHFTTEEPSTGAVIAVGTAAKPIVFTSVSATPAAGAWRGLWFGGIPSATDRIDHARIEYAGADCGCILNTCSDITEHEGAVIFTAQPPSAFITNTTIKDSAMHGIVQGFDGTLVNFRPTNTFESVAGCAETRPRNVDTTCPSPRPACDE